MKKMFIAFASLALLAGISSCKKDDGNSDSDGTGNNLAGLSDNTFKILKPDGTTELYTINVVHLDRSTTGQPITGIDCQYRIGNYNGSGSAAQNITPTTNDPGIWVYFYNNDPSGEYLPKTGWASGNNLSEGEGTLTLSRSGFGYFPASSNTGKIKAFMSNSKRKIVFENVTVTADAFGSGRLPEGSKVTGVIVEP